MDEPESEYSENTKREVPTVGMPKSSVLPLESSSPTAKAGRWQLVMVFLLGFASSKGMDMLIGGKARLISSEGYGTLPDDEKPKNISAEGHELPTKNSNSVEVKSNKGDEVVIQESEQITPPPSTLPPTLPPTQPPAPSTSSFDDIVSTAYKRAITTAPRNAVNRSQVVFDIDYWVNESNLTTDGGLKREDRILLAQLYGNATSVFEYGLGESTYMANYLGVPRYAGIDSDPAWVAMARERVSGHYRFYLGDIGPTGDWGFPTDYARNSNKATLNYQLSPLILEQQPFDIYMVDGRWRMACALASFLHASDRGADPSKTKVLIHDCQTHAQSGRTEYKQAENLLEMVQHSGKLLCVYQRRPETTDEQLKEAWNKNVDVVKR